MSTGAPVSGMNGPPLTPRDAEDPAPPADLKDMPSRGAAIGPGLTLADAYLGWARATNFRDAGGKPQGDARWLWLLMELREAATAFFARSLAFEASYIRLPGHYADGGRGPNGLAQTRFCTAIVSDAFLQVLCGDATEAPPELRGLCRQVARFEIGFSVPPWRRGAERPAPAPPAHAAAQVVIGVIDDGLAFANARFCVDAGAGPRATRFLSLWDQGAPQDHGHPRWPYGRTYDAAELNATIARHVGVHGRVDEDAVYADAGYAAVAHRITHGTHVLDLAAGCDPAEASAAPYIVAVQIPRDVLEDTSCASSTVFLLDAVRHVLCEADSAFLDQAAGPAIINISLGNIAGPHDGSSIFESALTELLELRQAVQKVSRIVMPAGNSLLSQCHAWIGLKPGYSVTLPWRVRPGDGTPNFLELWFSPPGRAGRALTGAPGEVVSIDGISLEVTPPGQSAPVTVHADAPAQPHPSLPGACLFSLQQETANGAAGMGLLAVGPTDLRGEPGTPAPAGVWQVVIHNRGTRRVECNAYVQRDDIAFGTHGPARQSTLDDPRYQRFDETGRLAVIDVAESFVRRSGTFNGLATSPRVDVGGGAVQTDDAPRPARYSSAELPSAGPRGGRVHVDAITEDSAVLHGVLAAGTRSGSVVALSGTSMAAPQLTRRLAAPGALSGTEPSLGPQFPAAARAKGQVDETRSVLTPDDDLATRSSRRRG